jgi:hypothetical protein
MKRSLLMVIGMLAAFVVMGAPTCSSGRDARSTPEEVEESVRRRQAKALEEQVELAELLAKYSDQPVEVVVEPREVDWRSEVQMSLFLDRDGRECRAEYVADWMEPREDGSGRRENLMKWPDSVRFGGRWVSSRSAGSLGAALFSPRSGPVEVGTDDHAWFEAEIPDRPAARASVPLPPPLLASDVLEVVSWRGADRKAHGLVFLREDATKPFERLRIELDGQWGETSVLWRDRGPVLAFQAPTTSYRGQLTGKMPPIELPLPPFFGLRVERSSTVPLKIEPLVAAPEWVGDRFPALADPPIEMGSLAARSEITDGGVLVLRLWNAARPRDVVEVEGLVPVAFSLPGSAEIVLLARRPSKLALPLWPAPFVVVSTRGEVQELEVDASTTWFDGFKSGHAVFLRRYVEVDASGREEELLESIAVPIPTFGEVRESDET